MNHQDEWNPDISAAERYIRLAAKISPTRMPGGKATANKVIGYPSPKMRMLIRCESALERTVAVELEITPGVSAYYSQPPTCGIQTKDKKGRKCTVRYTPDFVCRSGDDIFVIEVKSINSITTLATDNPHEWEFDGIHALHKSYSKYFESQGMRHFVVIPDIYGKLRMHNLRTLDQALRRPLNVSERTTYKLLSALNEIGEVTIHEALSIIQLEDPLAIYKLIAKGIIHSPLEDMLLENTRSAKISLNNRKRKTHKKSPHPYSFTINSHEIKSYFGDFSQAELEEGRKKMEWYQKNSHRKHHRTVQRFNKLIKESEKAGIPAIAALSPKHSKKGNRTPKREEEVYRFMESFISKNWLSSRPIKKSILYGKYYNDAIANHPNSKPLSTTSFYKSLKAPAPHKVALAHKGRRGINSEKPPSMPGSREFVSNLAFFDTTIDHHSIDCLVEVASDGFETKKVRPYLSILLDRASHAVLAWHVDISAPSKSIVSILLRRALKEWGRLPVSIRTDRGSDFVSQHTEDLLAHLGIEKILSPKSDGRAGGEVERSFSEFTNDFVAGIPGYTPAIHNRREIDSDKDPSSMRATQLLDFIEYTEKFINLRNHRIHGEKSKSPKQLVTNSIEATVLAGIPCEQGFNFYLDTAIKANRFSIDFRRGLLVSGRRYFNDELNNHQLEKKNIEVRLDPENPCLVYVRINGRWSIATHKDLDEFNALSPHEQRGYNLWVTGGKSIRNSAKFQGRLRASELFDEIERKTFHINPTQSASVSSNQNIEYDFNYDGDTGSINTSSVHESKDEDADYEH